MNKIKLFLDVDGVLNAEKPSKDFDDWQYTEHPHQVADYQGSTWGYGGGMRTVMLPLWTSKKMGQMLLDLPVDIHWLTDWEHSANRTISPLVGFPTNLPTLTAYDAFMPNVKDAPAWWKARVIRKHMLMDGDPFIFLDDNIRLSDMGWSKKNNTVYGSKMPHLALSMNWPHSPGRRQPGGVGKNCGLTLEDLKKIKDFCDRLAPAGAKEKHPEEKNDAAGTVGQDGGAGQCLEPEEGSVKG